MLISNKYPIFVIAKIRKVAALIGSGNSSIISEYRDKLAYSMAGHALRGNLESVDYKEYGHSNPVIRSFITSSVRLNIKMIHLGESFFYLYIFRLFKASQYLRALRLCSLNVLAKLWVPEKSSFAHIYK